MSLQNTSLFLGLQCLPGLQVKLPDLKQSQRVTSLYSKLV